MTRALAAGRSYWWGRDPVQDWTYTAYVVSPVAYRRTLTHLADSWTVDGLRRWAWVAQLADPSPAEIAAHILALPT